MSCCLYNVMQCTVGEYNLLHVYVTIMYIQLEIIWPFIDKTTTKIKREILHHCFKFFQDSKWSQLGKVKHKISI